MAISLKHKSVTIDVNNRNAPNVVGIVNVNDKATRYLDVTLTASGEKLTFADCTVTATFATDGYLISDSVACTLNSTADLITVPLENFNSTSGFLSIEIKIANGETQVLNTPLTLKVMVTPSLAENSKISSESVGSFVEISQEIATARGGQNSLGARLDTADANLAKKANKSDIDSINSRLQSTETTLKNKANTTDVSNGLANKANKATTLAGYGITDAIKNAAGTVRVVNLAYDVKSKFDEKVNSSELFDVTKSINLANLADYSQYQNGVTITVSKNKISLSGTSTAAINAFLPLKTPIALQANKPYCLSLQDFTTNNTGCVFYPAHGQTVIDSKWLLSEVSALKNAAATYTPTQDIVIDHIKIAIAANRLTDNSCYLQIEQNNQKTAYVDPEKIVKKVKPTLYQGPDYAMHYLYVSNDYGEDTEGFGETKFNSILSANNSISDNSYHNRYTIVVMAGIYTDLQDKYAGMSDVGLVGYRGIMTKDYVYYESENIYNPAATVIKWDGATGFDKSTLKSEDIIKKCPFHLDLNVHTHIKGFTFDCKNIRYGIHLESGGTGYATNWVVGHCTFIWGGRADCVDYANKTTVPVFGCGHSFGEVGLIENCKIIPTHCTIGYQNHDNADNSDFGLPIKVGAKITFKDCDFGGTEIQARTLKGAYADTPNVLTIDNCINISAINKMYAAPADHCDWIVNTINSKNEQN